MVQRYAGASLLPYPDAHVSMVRYDVITTGVSRPKDGGWSSPNRGILIWRIPPAADTPPPPLSTRPSEPLT
jgi:hypothetical protein